MLQSHVGSGTEEEREGELRSTGYNSKATRREVEEEANRTEKKRSEKKVKGSEKRQDLF